MNSSADENIRDWLRDAHAMEEQAETLFSGQAERLKDGYGISAKLESELHNVKENQVLLSARIQQLGSSKSVIKDTAAKMVAAAQNISGLAVSDEPVKGVLALYTFTQMAIGSYKILMAAADAVNDIETRQICETILRNTELRAQWLEPELTNITKMFLANDA